ncbi:MAG: hypothetical protein RL885_02740 [Planctomycetota bacterium]
MNPDLEKFLRETEQECSSAPSRGGWYSKAGDCAFFFNEPDASYLAERVDGRLTVYRSLEDRRRIVGVQVKGIRTLPGHDFLEVLVRQSGTVDLIMLLYGTWQETQSDASKEPADRAAKRRTDYEDVLREFSGSTIDAKEFVSV